MSLSPIKPKVGLVTVTLPREYKEGLAEFASRGADKLRSGGCEVKQVEDFLVTETQVVERVMELEKAGVDLIIFFIGTWIEAPQVVGAIQKLSLPFVLWSNTSIPSYALGGATVTRYSLEEMGYEFLFVVADPGDDERMSRILLRAKSAALRNRLIEAKLGKIGGMTMGMYNATLDEFFWKRKLGVDFPQIDTYQIVKKMEKIKDKDAQRVVEKVKESVGKIVRNVKSTGEDLTDDDLLVQCKIYLALKEIISENNLSAISDKCQFELSSPIQGLGWTGCLAHALLNDDGMMCSCEADMPSCLTMFILNELTGKITYFGDLNSLIRDKNSARFINCGFGPLSMAASKEELVLWPVPHGMGYPGKSRGACTSFPFANGRVTLARIGGGKDTARMHIASGESVKSPLVPKGLFPERWPQLVVKLDGDLEEFVQTAMSQHYITVYGDYLAELVDFCDLVGIKAVVT